MTENGTSAGGHCIPYSAAWALQLQGSLVPYARRFLYKVKPACQTSAGTVLAYPPYVIRTRKGIDGLGMKEGSVDNDMSVVISEGSTIRLFSQLRYYCQDEDPGYRSH